RTEWKSERWLRFATANSTRPRRNRTTLTRITSATMLPNGWYDVLKKTESRPRRSWVRRTSAGIWVSGVALIGTTLSWVTTQMDIGWVGSNAREVSSQVSLAHGTEESSLTLQASFIRY